MFCPRRLKKHFSREPEKYTRKQISLALTVIQDSLRIKFGYDSCELGESTVYIGPRLIEMTDEHSNIVCRSISDVARSLGWTASN